jgi:hypothetical protein
MDRSIQKAIKRVERTRTQENLVDGDGRGTGRLILVLKPRCGRTHLIARAASLRRRALRRRSFDPREDLSALLVASPGAIS